MTDGVVQIVPDSTGKKVDTSELTRADGSTIVERQRVVLGDPANPSFFVNVDSAGRITAVVDHSQVLIELRRIAALLQILTNTEVTASDVMSGVSPAS